MIFGRNFKILSWFSIEGIIVTVYIAFRTLFGGSKGERVNGLRVYQPVLIKMFSMGLFSSHQKMHCWPMWENSKGKKKSDKIYPVLENTCSELGFDNSKRGCLKDNE